MVEKITTENMARLVEETFKKSLYREGESVTETIEIDGVAHKYAFNVERLKEQKETVEALVAELPAEFKQGWTFLNLCMTKDGGQWTGLQLRSEQLMVMAIALDLMKYCLPKNMWFVLPGGVPYVIVK